MVIIHLVAERNATVLRERCVEISVVKQEHSPRVRTDEGKRSMAVRVIGMVLVGITNAIIGGGLEGEGDVKVGELAP